MASGVNVGDHVWFNTGDGDKIGHVVKEEHDVDGETKATVQTPDGSRVKVGYREPKDRDDQGAGGTFWLV